MSQFLMPRVYTVEELGELSKASTDRFVSDRHRAEEELSRHYHDCFEKSYDDISRALYQTDNLFALKSKGQPLLIDGLLSILRNMDRPTVSEDDFKSLSDTGTAAASRFQDEQLSSAALEYLARNLNMDIFPWVEAGEQPTDKQKHAACVAFCSHRRSEDKNDVAVAVKQSPGEDGSRHACKRVRYENRRRP